MRPVSFPSDTLVRLLRHQKIATMTEMKAALGTAVDMTVFRKLRAIPYHASYSLRGKYYALDEVARFDDRGLWTYRDAHFSRFGSLVDTAAHFVARSAERDFGRCVLAFWQRLSSSSQVAGLLSHSRASA